MGGMMTGKVIAIDFDGTITKENLYPGIGEIRPNVFEAIRKIQELGNHPFIWTCRQGSALRSAMKLLKDNGLDDIPFNQCVYDVSIACGRKPIADYYIDDRNLFTPEIDWYEIEKFFTEGEE